MNTTRWLVAVLLASWTLNVALGVALYLKTKYPAGGYWSEPVPAFQPGMSPMERFSALPRMPVNEELRGKFQSYRENERRLMIEVGNILSEDVLDTARIRVLSDSIDDIRSEMHQLHIQFLTQMHDCVPPEVRREIVPRLMNRIGHPDMRMESRHRRYHDQGRRFRDSNQLNTTK